MESKNTLSSAFKISTVTILTAITTIFTIAVRIPIAPTRGYINLGDVAIYFSAITFGPFSALVSGGLGTALADILSGYSQWAPISFAVHGLEGLVIGLIVQHFYGENSSTANLIVAWTLAFIAGTVVMAGGYLLAENFIVGLGAALTELPGNIIQNIAGIAGGIPLALAIKKAYPPVVNFKW
ncbi:MAG: ECF transporter S component [Spirochaetes bacterium]|nr:MAG: ECF transporter S component [Spirochaetota bacterium]